MDPDATPWTRIAPEIDRALDRLSAGRRNAVLLRSFLNYDSNSAALILRTRERCVTRRVKVGLKKIAKRLSRRGAPVNADLLAMMSASEACSSLIPENLLRDVSESLEQAKGKRPSLKLACRTLNVLAWRRWRRRMAIGLPTFMALLVVLAGAAWYVDSLSGHSRLISAFLVWSARREAKTVPGLAQAARPWPTTGAHPPLDAAAVHSARDLYQTTNIWLAHLSFSRDEWRKLQPKRIAALPHFLQSNGTALLRNPEAHRSGLAGYWVLILSGRGRKFSSAVCLLRM